MREKLIVLGAGESGLGTAILGIKQGYEVFVSDHGKIPEATKRQLDELAVAWEENTHTLSNMIDANCVMNSPGIPNSIPLVNALSTRNIPIVSEIEFASKFTTATLIGITGTNGKTTTALMTYHILKNAGYEVALAGNIGNSFAKEVAENDCQYYVLEISSFQLDDIVNFAPHIGVITNITPDHLDRYNNDFGQYLKSKLRINKNQSERDVLLFNADDEVLTEAVEKIDTQATLHPL